MALSDKQWKYINEGNVHIVLEILNTGYVLRLIKEEKTSINVQSVQDGIAFVNLVTAPLICANSRYQEELVELTTETLTNLSKTLHEKRPHIRKYKSVISKFAIKAPNLTRISQNIVNYCLEIKPKEGFKCMSLEKLPKCYYCLKQFVKLHEKQIKSLSNYCPLSFFSGDRKRMKSSLIGLLNNPQNNLKIFKDGEIVYNEKSALSEFEDFLISTSLFTSTNLFLDFIIDILLSKGNLNTILQESEPVSLDWKPDKCLENNQLESDMFLYKLLSVQKLSENVLLQKENIVSGFGYVSTILENLQLQKLQLYTGVDRKWFLEYSDPLHLALISAVAKDCSIMISFTSESIGGYPNILVGANNISYRISVTDLEPKSSATLAKRERTEIKLNNVYQTYVKSTETSFCKYFRIQPHSETRLKQLEAWQQLITEYMKVTKQSTIDIRESQNNPLFNNTTINRKLSQESVLTVLEVMAKTGRAAPIDKSKNVWEIYWHSLDEWGNMIYSWACSNGMNNSVCTLFELTEGENTEGEEFHGLDVNVLIKALKSLEMKGKCELIQFDDNQGVKFF